LLAALVVLAAVCGLFFLPLARGETYHDVINRQAILFPWAGTSGPGQSVLHYDQTDTFYPWRVFVNRALRSGELPLWNPYSFAGQPFLANGQNGVLYPPRLLLSLIASPERVYDVLMTSHAFIGGATMLLLLVWVGLSLPAGLFGAIAWMFNSFMLAWMVTEHYLVIQAWLPLAMGLVWRAIDRRSWLASVGAGVVLALIFVGGNLLFVEASLLAWGGWGACLLLDRWRRELPGCSAREVAQRLLGESALIGLPLVLMAGLVAFQALPTLDLVRSMQRRPPSYDEVVQFRLPVSHALTFFFPYLRFEDVYHSALFMGTPTAVLGLVGLMCRRPLATYSAALAVTVLLIALGTPLTWLAYEVVPAAGYLRPPSRALFLFDFAVSVLAAYGLDRIVWRGASGPSSRSGSEQWPGWCRSGSAVVLGAAVLVQMHQFSAWFIRHQPDETAYLYPETPLIRALERDDTTRILPVIPGNEVAPAQTGRFLFASTALVFPVQNASGYDSLVPDRIANFWRVVEGDPPEQAVAQRRLNAYGPDFFVASTRFDLLARVGVTHVVTPPYVEGDPAWTADRVGMAGLRLVYQGPDGRTYRVSDPLPRAYLVPACERVESGLGGLERFAASDFDATRTVLLEAADLWRVVDNCGPPVDTRADTPVGSAELLRRGLNALTVQVNSEHDAWLVINESWDPGWRATVDGVAAAVLPANYAFRAIRIPAGARTVELWYWPATYSVGAAISALTLLLLLTFGLGSVFVGRRARGNQP